MMKSTGKHYDRKVIHTRTSRLLSVSKVIPQYWQYVRITPLQSPDLAIYLKIEKLLEDEHNAQTSANNKRGKQDT